LCVCVLSHASSRHEILQPEAVSDACRSPFPLFEIHSSGNGDRSGNAHVSVTTEESLGKYFSFFESYCKNKPWLFYMYCVYQKYEMLASAARDMPVGTGANGALPGHPTAAPPRKDMKRRSSGGGVEAVKITKSKEGKKLERAKRKCAEITVVAVKAQLIKDLEEQHTALSKGIKTIKDSGEEVPTFKLQRLRKLEKDLGAALKSDSESGGESGGASDSGSGE
jgi:hypothetical protein